MTMLDPFYPVVPDSSWVARLVPAGARLIQLRIKEQPPAEIRRQVKEAKAICAAGGAQLIDKIKEHDAFRPTSCSREARAVLSSPGDVP